MSTVKIAVVIKRVVAIIDLLANRGIPQTPCPEVQPDPNLVPKPTINPAIINVGYDE